MNKADILKRQIEAIENSDGSEIKSRFMELFGFECGATNGRNIRNRMICKLQEIYFGGISDADREQLAKLAENDPLSNLKTDVAKPRKMSSGTRLRRNWNGADYEVIALSDGQFEFEGEKYRSLSAVASKITGTHWNGKKFFGVK